MNIDPKLSPYNGDDGVSAAYDSYERKSVGVSLLDVASRKKH